MSMLGLAISAFASSEESDCALAKLEFSTVIKMPKVIGRENKSWLRSCFSFLNMFAHLAQLLFLIPIRMLQLQSPSPYLPGRAL
jgi:hypothetical protein